MKKLVTLIIPAFNEEKSLPVLLDRLGAVADSVPDYRMEFLFINDGSQDDTARILSEATRADERVSVINLSRNFGKEVAVAAGLDNADGDAVVIIDADCQEPPELIPEMIHYWEQGYDDVYARRHKNGGGKIANAGSKLYYRMLQRMARTEIQVDTSDFRLFSRRCMLALREIREASRQNKAIFSWIGYKKKEIVYEPAERVGGESKWSVGWLSPGNSLVNLAIDGFTSASTLPLRFASITGFVVCFVAFVYMAIIIIQTLCGFHPSAGYPSLMACVLFLGGLQLLFLGLLGEYIGRIFVETKRRPLYLIEDMHRAATAVSDGSTS